jgi:hypothetical protein
MRPLLLAALCAGFLGAAGCRIEDHTPAGSRQDEEAVQGLVAGYARTLSDRDWSGVRALFWDDATYSGPMVPGSAGPLHQAVPIDSALSAIARAVRGAVTGEFDVRILRTDFRQEGDLASVWVTTRRRIPAGSRIVERDWIEHLVLRRIGGTWRILSVTAASAPRGSLRASR